MVEEESNIVWLLFSAREEKISAAMGWYTQRTNEWSGVINQLFESYQMEGMQMPYTMQDFYRDVIRDKLTKMTEQERQDFLEAYSSEERLKGIPVEERFKGVPVEERLIGLSEEEKKTLLETLLEDQKDKDS